MVLFPKYPPAGVKKGEKYVFATDATPPSYSQSSFTRARAHARACQEWEISVASVPELGEAKRIAGELAKMHRDAAIRGAEDPEARFYAQVLHTFGRTFLGRYRTSHVWRLVHSRTVGVFSFTLSAFPTRGVLLISLEVALPKSYPFKYLSHNVSKNYDVKHDQGSCQTLHLETPSNITILPTLRSR